MSKVFRSGAARKARAGLLRRQEGIDEVTHTDGLDVFSGALPGYPRGMLVVQDDGNPAKEQNQNFKMIDWSSVETALGLPILEAE